MMEFFGHHSVECEWRSVFFRSNVPFLTKGFCAPIWYAHSIGNAWRSLEFQCDCLRGNELIRWFKMIWSETDKLDIVHMVSCWCVELNIIWKCVYECGNSWKMCFFFVFIQLTELKWANMCQSFRYMWHKQPELNETPNRLRNNAHKI